MSTGLRIGQGYDVHAFTSGDHVMLGGERMPHSHGVLAHSDGDVLLHALCDALLGAAGLGDIGMHFPDSDPRWRGADSRAFLRHVATAAAGSRLSRRERRCDRASPNAPRLGQHREAMRANIGSDLGDRPRRGSTSRRRRREGLGFIGRARRAGVPGDRADRADDGNTDSVTVFEEMATLPCAHGGPAGRAQLRAAPEDFVVREWLGFEADGARRSSAAEGAQARREHAVGREAARAARRSIHPRDVGFAGLKDRDAVAEQSFTVPARSAIGESTGSASRAKASRSSRPRATGASSSAAR